MSPNIALVGCGAIARQFHLAAIANRRDDFDRVWIVDPSDTARQTACAIVKAEQSATLNDVPDDLQFVIVACPNAHHFSVAREALLRGAHVLIEKPFVIWPDEGRELITLAAERHRLVTVNQTRRFFPHTQELRKRISAGDFGALKSIVHNEGVKLDWPFLSGAGFAHSAKRTGVIMDMGVHILDFYQYLLSPTWTYQSAIHDGFNGPEGLAQIRLKANDASVSIRMSRYQKQDNVALLDFEKARVQIGVFDFSSYSVTNTSSGASHRFVVNSAQVDSAFLSDRILTNFISAAMGQEEATCEAASSLPVIDLLDTIYRSAERYPETLGAV